MFDSGSRHSIKFRFMRIIAGILLASTLAVTFITAQTESRKLHGFLQHKGDGMASYIAKLSQDPLITDDLIRLDFFVNEANKDDDVVYAVIYDANGQILTSSFAGLNHGSQMLGPILAGLPKGSELPEVIAEVERKGKNPGYLTELVAIVLGKDYLMKIVSPVMSGNEQIGTVAIGLSEHTVHRSVLETMLFLILLNLCAALVLGGVLFAVSKRVVFEPISELTAATRLLAEGNLAARVTGTADGELRVLADGFNAMAEALDKRSRELVETRDELVRSEKMAMLGLIAGNMGNELRNPLGVMNNAVFFLKNLMPGTDETVREYLDIIKDEIDNSRRIISDLVDFACNKKPSPKCVAVGELVDRAVARCGVPENVIVRNEIREDTPPLMVDPGQIEQVLKNLVANAVQAMPDGGSLSIGAESLRGAGSGKVGTEEKMPDTGTSGPDVSGDFLAIGVADTGEGVAPENVGKLFTPLYSTRSRGIGLGLALSAKLVEANGGRIEVESGVGRGATFTVVLPVCPEAVRT